MGILNALNTGCDALKVHGARLDAASRNIANIDTPNYKRKVPIIAASNGSSFLNVINQMRDSVYGAGTIPASGSVMLTGIAEDPSLGEKIYKPGHPDADENGYIRTSNVDPLVEITDGIMAQRAYEAGIAIITMTKQMADRASQIGQS